MSRAEYFDQIQCGLLRVMADFVRHEVELYLPDGQCTDMQGAIKYALEIDPGVRHILTIAGGRRDTAYYRDGERWKAFTDGAKRARNK